MNGQIQTQTDKQERADMPEPFLESLHFASQLTDTYSAIAYQPRNEHNRQTRTQTEDYRHQPIPRTRQRKRDINHRQEINQPVRTKGDGEEDTQDKGP